MTAAPSKAGVYALVLLVSEKTTLEVGRLGPRDFASGIYVYVGSAMNTLPGRVSRHLRREKKKHWHIDYLLDETGSCVLGVAWKYSRRRIECWVSRNIHGKAVMSVEDFGCGDCDCGSHLHYFHGFGEALRAVSQVGLYFSSSTHLPRRETSACVNELGLLCEAPRS